MIRYPIGTSGQDLVLTEPVLAHFRRFRQNRWFSREAGGQLFATLAPDAVTIVEATGPRRTDRRGPFWYLPNRRAEQAEIDERHRRGLHFVGDWHTHPEDRPSPSHPDCNSIKECVRKSRHSLLAFVVVVVGRTESAAGLYVAVHDGTAAHVLSSAPVSG